MMMVVAGVYCLNTKTTQQWEGICITSWYSVHARTSELLPLLVVPDQMQHIGIISRQVARLEKRVGVRSEQDVLSEC
jgi:hypothetical protein